MDMERGDEGPFHLQSVVYPCSLLRHYRIGPSSAIHRTLYPRVSGECGGWRIDATDGIVSV